MVGELAAGASSRWTGGRYRHRIALGTKRTGRRGGVGKEGNNVACTYLFGCWPGRTNEREAAVRRVGGAVEREGGRDYRGER